MTARQSLYVARARRHGFRVVARAWHGDRLVLRLERSGAEVCAEVDP